MAALWQIQLMVAEDEHVFGEMLDAACDAEAVSIHRDHDDDPWQLMIITKTAPDADHIARAIKSAEQLTGVTATGYEISKLPDADWLAENRKSFPPLDIAGFWIYGDYVKDPVPKDRIGLKIDAGEAFGSGTHATTHGCIAMLVKHCPKIKNNDKLTIADIGCGSGILAMAAAKLRPMARIIAVDNDPIAVTTAAKNADVNDVQFIRTACVDGYKDALVKGHAPYDVILANILPSPLIAMAADAAACLGRDGVIILSGLTTAHDNKVIMAHENFGFVLFDRMVISDWVTLVMKRKIGG